MQALKLFSIAGIFSLLVSTGAAFAQPKTIRVAGNLPLSGDLGQYGTAIQQGSLLAMSEIEQRPSGGLAIVFDWQDNKGNNRDAYTIMSAQLASHPDIYLSGLKPQTMTITEQVSKAGIPHFTWILDVKINPSSSNNFRAWVSFKSEADAYLKALEKQSPTRIAMLYVQLPAAELQFKELLVPALKQRGAQDIWVEAYPADTQDFKTLALKTKAFKPDLIVLNGFAPHLTSLIRNLRQLKLIRPGNTLASLDMLEAAERLSNEEREGIVVAAPDYITDSGNALRTAWTKRFLDKFGVSPSYHSAFAYDSILAITAAADKLSAHPSSADWINALRMVSIEGITGKIEFDIDGSSTTAMQPAMYKNGSLVLLGNKDA